SPSCTSLYLSSSLTTRHLPQLPLFPYTTLFRSLLGVLIEKVSGQSYYDYVAEHVYKPAGMTLTAPLTEDQLVPGRSVGYTRFRRSEEHTSELQSRVDLVCRLLLEKKKNIKSH